MSLLGFGRWFKTLVGRFRVAYGAFTLGYWIIYKPLPWKAVAHRYRRWFLAENSGSYKLKRDRDQATYRLWLSHRCVFCGLPFGDERVTWLSGWDRGYCDSCRDDIEAREREEAEDMARHPYAARGVPKKDFY